MNDASMSQFSQDVPIEEQEPKFEIPLNLKRDDELVVKMMTEKNNPFGLSPQERRVIYYWQKGKTQTEAYKKVMLSKEDRKTISTSALRKRVMRFYDTFRIREAMAASPGLRGLKAREDYIKWRQKQRDNATSQFKSVAKKIGIDVDQALSQTSQEDAQDSNYNDSTSNYSHGESKSVILDEQRNVSSEQTSAVDQSVVEHIVRTISSESSSEQRQQAYSITNNSSFDSLRSDRDMWIESLNINKDPSAMTIYGTGQFLAYVAVKEIMDRQKAIKERHLDVLGKNGSALTPNIISAIKTAAAMILPFAPAPSAEDRREMSKAAVLLGLMPDKIEESPDAYTAPPPVTIDVTQEN